MAKVLLEDLGAGALLPLGPTAGSDFTASPYRVECIGPDALRVERSQRAVQTGRDSSPWVASCPRFPRDRRRERDVRELREGGDLGSRPSAASARMRPIALVTFAMRVLAVATMAGSVTNCF